MKQPTLGFSTLDGGAIQATNGVDETLTMVMGEQFDGTNTAASITGPTPPTPTMAMAMAAPASLRVYWDGTFAQGAVAPMDWARVTVHIVPLADYEPETFTPLDQAQIYGSFESARGGEISPALEPGEYVVLLVAWSQSGKFSVPSDPELGTVEEIETGDGTDGNAPATAPTVAWTGGIGSVFYRWNQVANEDPTEYALYVRAGAVPTTTDDTYLVASGNVTQAIVRSALGEDPENPGGPEVERNVEPGVDFYGVVVAYDDDGQGPDSMPAIAQSVEITSPDIATDAIATRHLQADSVGLNQLQAGSIDADKFVGRLILASEMLLGTVDNSGLDPAELEPNLLPSLDPSNFIHTNSAEEGKWSDWASDTGWTAVMEEYVPPNDDTYWERMAPGTLHALRLTRAESLASSSATFYTAVTMVPVEPLTEYRLELNSAMPGMDPEMPLDPSVMHNRNSVKWWASSNYGFSDAETVSWKSFTRDNTTRGELTKFDRGILRTGAGQNWLYLAVEVRANYMPAGAGGFLIVKPELRKMTTSTTIPLTVTNPATVSDADVTPDPASTGWKASAVWSGTSLSATARSSAVVVVSSQNGTFPPSRFATPGRYAIPGESHSFQQAKGVRITTQSAGSTLGLRARLMAPGMEVPALSPMESLMVDVGFSGISTSGDSGLDDFKFNASWYDETNAFIETTARISLDAAGVALQGITSTTENYFSLQLQPPVGAKRVVFWAEFTNGSTGNLVASTNYTPTIHGLRLYTLQAINYNYGNMAKRRVQIDGSGIRLMNTQGQVQISIPTDENETPLFRGGIEAEWARFFGGVSFEGVSEVAKDAVVTLSDGIKAPVTTPLITQEYETYSVGRIPEGWDTEYTNRPTLNPSQITGMCYKDWNSGEFWAAENRGGGIAIWRFRRDGSPRFATFSAGFQWAVPFNDPRHPGGNLFAGEWGGKHWAYVYSPGAGQTILNRIPDGIIPSNVHAQFYWNTTNDRLYAFYPHVDGSGRNVYKRLRASGTEGGEMVLEDTVVGGSGTSRTSASGGLAGVAIIGSRVYTAARGATSVQTYVFEPGGGGSLDPGARWDLAGPPVAFCHDGDNFWQIDTSGNLTRYSNWTWTELDHKLFAGMTWYDNDPAGTGTHETNIVGVSQALLKKRISGVRITLPRVPDNGGVDDPTRWRLYARKSASLALPADRTEMFLQAQGGSPLGETTYIIPANGLITAGTNPPELNNFPSAGPGRVISSAVTGGGDPLIDFRGNGDYRLAGKNLDDIPWTTFAVATGFAPVGGESPQYMLKNGVVYLRGRVTKTAAWSTTSDTLATLPAAIRPNYPNVVWATTIGSGGSQYPGRVYVNSSGNLTGNAFGTTATNQAISITGSYPLG